MTYAVIAVERAMKIQEVILRAMSGALTWLQAADILGMHPRSLRRWRARQQRVGYDWLLDRRRQRPSRRLAPFAEVERILRLYGVSAESSRNPTLARKSAALPHNDWAICQKGEFCKSTAPGNSQKSALA